MKFLVDAHLPRGLCAMLARHGHDATHTLELPAKNATKDHLINQISLDDQRVVISKDRDFFYSHLLLGRPWKLVLVKTGNISTRDLRALFERNLPAIETALEHHTLVEIDRLEVTPVVYLHLLTAGLPLQVTKTSCIHRDFSVAQVRLTPNSPAYKLFK